MPTDGSEISRRSAPSYMIFYDKWIDGLVFHDTKTTGFKTQRDFVRELAAACQRSGLPLVFYFNAISDGNPEFDAWALTRPAGQADRVRSHLADALPDAALAVPREGARAGPRVADRLRPDRRDLARHLLRAARCTEPVDRRAATRRCTARNSTGVRRSGWPSSMSARWPTISTRSRRSAARRGRTVASSRPTARAELPRIGNAWTRQVGSRLHYLFDEGHSFERNDSLARMAWVLPKPMEVNFLLNSSWFTPLEDAPPPSHLTEKQAIAATAIAVCQGASVNFALTPGHAGEFGEDLQRAKAAGAWFRQVKNYVTAAQPYADVGIVLGTPPVDGQGFPAVSWTNPLGLPKSASEQAFALADAVLREGMFSRTLYAWEGQGSWPASLASYAAVLLPEQALLDTAHAEQLRNYVREGGTLVAFGKAALGNAVGQPSDQLAWADLFGVQCRGEVVFPADCVGASVKVDSEYSPEFAAQHLLDEFPTAWASGGGPLPHWAEITLPRLSTCTGWN